MEEHQAGGAAKDHRPVAARADGDQDVGGVVTQVDGDLLDHAEAVQRSGLGRPRQGLPRPGVGQVQRLRRGLALPDDDVRVLARTTPTGSRGHSGGTARRPTCLVWRGVARRQGGHDRTPGPVTGRVGRRAFPTRGQPSRLSHGRPRLRPAPATYGAVPAVRRRPAVPAAGGRPPHRPVTVRGRREQARRHAVTRRFSRTRSVAFPARRGHPRGPGARSGTEPPRRDRGRTGAESRPGDRRTGPGTREGYLSAPRTTRSTAPRPIAAGSPVPGESAGSRSDPLHACGVVVEAPPSRRLAGRGSEGRAVL